jgi:hypothetical protein
MEGLMWRKTLLFLLFAFYSLCVIVAVEAEPWYLIRESELQSIEAYKKNSEAEKQSWLSQVQRLSRRAGSLEAESAALNRQLLDQRERNRSLTESFNRYEAEQSLLMSQKDTRIGVLEAENEGKRRIIGRLVIAVIALGAAWLVYAARKVFRFLKISPL